VVAMMPEVETAMEDASMPPEMEPLQKTDE
jgi:hypothetical protein